MRYMTRGIVVIALCSMTTSCSRPDGAGPDNDIVAAGPELTADLEQLRVETTDHLMRLSAPEQDLVTNLDIVTEAALEGEIDVEAMDAILGSLEASQEELEKATEVLNRYAESVIEGHRLDESLEPGVALGALALCNTCPTAQNIPAATASCQFISGDESSTCLDQNYYRVQVPANSDCTFTTCPSWACGSGANATYDTYLWLYNSSCGLVASNDDVSCTQTFRSGIEWSNTSTSAVTMVIRVGGYSSSTGNFNLGYRCVPRPESCTFDGLLGTPQPDKATWMRTNRIYRNGVASTCANNKSCPGTYSSSTRAYDRWDMPTNATPECVTVETRTTGCTSSMVHSQAFTGSFPVGNTFACNPAPGVSYLGDAGSSAYVNGPRNRYSFDLAANTPWSILVTGANSSQTNCAYSFEVSPCETIPPSECAPRLVSMDPTSGSAGDGCAAAERFTVNFQHDRWDPPVVLDWSITPPAGGSAAPASGTLNINSRVESVQIPQLINFIRANCPASGAFPIEMSVTNNCQEPISERTFTYNLNDDTPPVMGPRSDICLWPPNHEMLCQDAVDLRDVTDNCGDEGIVGGAEACVSDQPDNSVGDGNTEGDCVIAIDDVGGQQIVCTRAERSGTIGEGRTYEIRGRYRDACGNFTPSTTLQVVSVPHDMREHPECISPL